jgi:4-hydroxybenzoate polyprenyltransferase
MNSSLPAQPALLDVARALRVNQWTKNAVVLAAFFFGYWDHAQNIHIVPHLAIACAAALLFCLASSGIYLINDVRDLQADRAHPEKRHRPIAAGRVPPGMALRLAAVLLACSLGGAFMLSTGFLAALGGYVALQIAYSTVLKRIALVDVFVIAGGFVLRALSGALALKVVISPWLLLCAFLLALFLALCKRRHEKVQMNEESGSRRSLESYSERLLDQLIAIIASATIVSYAIYALSAATELKFGTNKLGFTIPFVIFGIFRYMDLVYRHEKGDRPEKILLTDVPLLVNLALYAGCTIVIFLTIAR